MSNLWHFRQIPQKKLLNYEYDQYRHQMRTLPSFKFPMRHIFMHWLAKRASFQSLEAECRLNYQLTFQISFPPGCTVNLKLFGFYMWKSPRSNLAMKFISRGNFQNVPILGFQRHIFDISLTLTIDADLL